MDEDSMEEAVSRALRARAIDLETALEAGLIERTDVDHLLYATGQNRVLCTYNVSDFWALHVEYLTRGAAHAGIVLMPQQRYAIGELVRRLLRLANALTQDEMVSRAEFLSGWEPSR
jgi:hypothetical protein